MTNAVTPTVAGAKRSIGLWVRRIMGFALLALIICIAGGIAAVFIIAMGSILLVLIIGGVSVAIVIAIIAALRR